MPDVNLGALTIPVFTAIFGAGWTSCYVIVVKPMIARIVKLEQKQEAIELSDQEELKMLRQKVYGG